MMIYDVFNSHVDPVRTEMTGTQNIPILRVCDLDEIISKDIIADENLSQICSMDESESESVISDESYMEEIKSESVHKIINKIRKNMQLMKQKMRNLW